jgi:predicted Zn-dependent protease
VRLTRLAIISATAVSVVALCFCAQAQTPGQNPSATPPSLPTQDEGQIKHDGGKSDVDAVGNRNVGCTRGVGNWYTVDRQVALGRSLAQQIDSQVKLINDPVVTEYVNRIGQNLVRNSDAQVPFTIKVIDSDVINAMALPGGFFYVNSGLILAADEEAEMAGAMAHEIAHVAACHMARQLTRDQLLQMSTIPLIIGGGPIGYGAYQASGLAGALGASKFSREFETEADYLGIQYMYRSGYDPSALVSFFEKIQAMERKKAGTLSKAFDTHPQNKVRIEKSQKEIRKILPAKQQYLVTSSEFDRIKARLAELENKHKLLDEKDSDKPSLRRTSNGDDKSGDPKSDDDRPKLKRRDDPNWM